MKTRGHTRLRIDLLAGGRYVGIPHVAVNGRYDALPPRSAKFNSERDNSVMVIQSFSALWV